MSSSNPNSTSRVTSNSPSTRQDWIGSDGLCAPLSLPVTYRTCSCSLWVHGTSRPIGKRTTFRDRCLRHFEDWNVFRRIERYRKCVVSEKRGTDRVDLGIRRLITK